MKKAFKKLINHLIQMIYEIRDPKKNERIFGKTPQNKGLLASYTPDKSREKECKTWAANISAQVIHMLLFH
jgi:hypothetical protein